MAGTDQTVRGVIGNNIGQIRRNRALTVRDLSARLKALGLSLSASGVSDIENASRKIAADELLIFAIALNTSVIDLLTPRDGAPLTIAEHVEPIQAGWLEGWLQGNHPWPLKPTDESYNEQYLWTASEFRKRKQRTDMRPEIQEIGSLRDAVASAIDGPGKLNQIADPQVMARHLRDQLGRVEKYVSLLADRIEKQGYDSSR